MKKGFQNGVIDQFIFRNILSEKWLDVLRRHLLNEIPEHQIERPIIQEKPAKQQQRIGLQLLFSKEEKQKRHRHEHQSKIHNTEKHQDSER